MARRHYKGLTWLGRARRAGGAPANDAQVDFILLHFLYTTDFTEESSHFIAIKPDIVVSHFLFEILLTFSMYKRFFKPQ